MKPIVAAIDPVQSRPEIVNLQSGLLLLLEKAIIAVNPEDRPSFAEGLRSEQQTQIYGSATRKLVSYFQEQGNIGDIHWIIG